jgi:anaerobic magnesium-protoporphyrin IX monomethyl ester cyclase
VRIALIYPPLADATQPYSSLAALAGFLRARGNHEAILHDVNLDFALHMLTREQMPAPSAGGDSFARFKTEIVREEIDAAIASLRAAETFLDLARLNHARRVVQDAWDLLNEGPLHATLDSWNVEHLDRFARDRTANPFFAFLESVTLPMLENAAPHAVGISVTYRRQIVPAITLALLVRQRMRVPVILGGQMISIWRPALTRLPRLFDWADYAIVFEGETALETLLTALERGAPLDDVPNLAYRRDGRVHVNSIHVEDINTLPAPDYEGLPLTRYLAPEPVLLLNTSRGCYWSKCEFCSVSPSMRHRFRMRRPDLVLSDIATLQARHGARCISFGDDCIPPRMLEALAHGLSESGLDVAWQCEVRFEAKLDALLLAELRDAGCRNLIFGLESYAPDVLDAMNKGVRHAEIRRILDDCRASGIAFNLQFFFGFPGETAADAKTTTEFVTGELHGAATLSFGTFRLQRDSGVARRPDAFGVRFAADPQSLAPELEYEPRPPYAEDARRDLHALALRRTRFGSLPLGIDAHTLVYLRNAGVSAMEREYYAPPPRVTAGLPLRRPAAQSIADGVLYDYETDRAVEISELATWLLDQLDHPRTPRQLARTLARTTGARESKVRTTIVEIAGALAERGMIEV